MDSAATGMQVGAVSNRDMDGTAAGMQVGAIFKLGYG